MPSLKHTQTNFLASTDRHKGFCTFVKSCMQKTLQCDELQSLL